jgi:PEP-CTERM motif
MRNFAGLALAAAAFTLAPAAQAVVATTGPDTGADGSFTIGFSGSNVSQPGFSEFFTFSTSVAGFLSAVISTTGGGPNSPNDVDFTRVFITGDGITGSQGDLLAIAGSNDVNEFRALNDLFVSASSFRLTTEGTSSGQNGSYGGSVSFRPAGAVPEPATWAMMLIGFAGVGVAMRRRRPAMLRQAA